MNKTDMMRQLGAGVAMFVRKADLTAEEALKVKNLHPAWVPGEKVEPGNRRLYDDVLYEVREGQGHTTQLGWEPDKTPALWAVVDEVHAGTKDDPIPWMQGMRPEKDKYYVEGDLLAKCIEDPQTTLHHNLSALCPGRYFEKAAA